MGIVGALTAYFYTVNRKYSAAFQAQGWDFHGTPAGGIWGHSGGTRCLLNAPIKQYDHRAVSPRSAGLLGCWTSSTTHMDRTEIPYPEIGGKHDRTGYIAPRWASPRPKGNQSGGEPPNTSLRCRQGGFVLRTVCFKMPAATANADSASPLILYKETQAGPDDGLFTGRPQRQHR